MLSMSMLSDADKMPSLLIALDMKLMSHSCNTKNEKNHTKLSG